MSSSTQVVTMSEACSKGQGKKVAAGQPVEWATLAKDVQRGDVSAR
jgi:hypothetical protein